MKKITKFYLLMLALMVSSSFLFAQNMSLQETQDMQRLIKQKDAALGPVTYAPNGTLAQGDVCTDPYSYGNIGDPAQNGSITSYGEQWYSFTGSVDQTVTVSLCGSGFDTKLEVWYACTDGSYAFYNDDACGVQSEIGGIPFTAGATMYAKVYGYSSSSGNYTLQITGVLPPPPPDPITAFPFNEDFESGSFPSTMVPNFGDQSDLFVSPDAADNSNYGSLFEGGIYTGWTSYYNVTVAFANTSHVAKLEMEVQPTGQSGLLMMDFDLRQKYTYNNVNYEWFRVLVNGTPVADVDGNFWQQASSPMADDFTLRSYDLSAYQVLGSFSLTLENAGKYWSGYTSSYDGDQAAVDNFTLYYLTLGNVEGHVFNGNGLSIAGATVGMEGYPTTTSDATGYYLLSNVAGENQDVTAAKAGYNVITDNFYITPGGTTTHDFTLTQPSLTINPLFFDETLNPNEYLTTYLGILNTGDGDGGWSAVINYPPTATVLGSQDITQVQVRDFSNVDYSGTNLNTIPDGNGEPMSARAGLDCPAGSVFAYPAVGSTDGYTSDLGIGYQCYQSFSGATGSFTTVTVWAIHTSAPSGPRELQVEVYGPGATPGTLESSTIVMVDPINTGVPVIGYDTYSYTIDVPSSSLTSGWISVAATAGGSPTFYWLNTNGTPSYPAMQNSNVLGVGLALCLSSSGVSGWLSLSDYDGIVPANGGSQNVGVNFDATGTAVGDVYTAEIVLSTDPEAGTFTIPVTMTIFGDPLSPVTDLAVELTNAVTGQVDLTWSFTTDLTFQYFMVRRDGVPIGTTTDLFYTDMLPDFGTYCYTVTPVFDEGNGVPAGPECTQWYIPALCWSPATLYNQQWPDTQEEVTLTLENCGEGTLDFSFPNYVTGSRFACDMQVALFDSYGDGWNGGSLDVFVNGNIVLSGITLSNGTGPEYHSFPVEGGDDISTIYTPGSWTYENSYEFYDGDGNMIYHSANTSMPTGVIYGTCPQPSYIVDVQPAMGQIAQGSTLDITLTYDATGFPAGIYDEWLNITTNDPDRLSDSIFNQMEVYTPGQLFGTVTDCNSGMAMSNVTVTATGTLGGVYTTETDGSGYYEMYVDEDTYDVGFSLLGFDATIVTGIYAPAGVMTEVSTTLCETPYPVNWVFADPNLNDTECMVTWTLPMGPYEIIYDDGEANDYVIWTTPGGGAGVHFTPAGYPATVIGGRLYVGDGSFPAGANFLGTQMAVGVLADDGVNGLPGTVLDSVVVDVANYGWVDFYGVFSTTITEGDFYIVMWQLGLANNSAPVGVDTDLPTVYRSAVQQPGGGWVISPYQDFMIRAYVSGPNQGVVSRSVSSGQMVRLPRVTEGPFLATSLPKGISGTVKDGEFKPVEVSNAQRDMTNYTIARVSNFDPDLGPSTGTLTPIANPTTESYNDTDFGGLDPGFYAYAVKAVYESGQSIWVYSNTVGHDIANQVTITASLCDGNDPDNAEVTLQGLDYPYQSLFGLTDIDGVVVFDSVIDGHYDLFVSKVGYTDYEDLNIAIFNDFNYSLVLTEKAYAARNLYVDSLTSVATWDEPLIAALFPEGFEGTMFPPAGWQSTTNDIGWFRSDDASSANWTIPAGDGFYAVANDDVAGSVSDGSEDYLITPMLDLRESNTFNLNFSSFYDGSFGESAYVEYSFDNGATWEVLQTLTPSTAWTDLSVDLSAFSGIDSDPIWLAFHADDNAGQASGWAVDNVAVNNGPSPIIGYYVYLDGAFVTQTDADVRTWTFFDLAYGQTYTASVRALYSCGLSDPIDFRWTSSYLHPPRNIGDDYVYGTNEVPIMWNPPMTGVVPMTSVANVFDNLVVDNKPVKGSTNYSRGKAPVNNNYISANPVYINTNRNGDNIAWLSSVTENNLYTMDMATYSTTTVGPSATDPASGDFMNNDYDNFYVATTWGADLSSVAVATGVATYIAPFSGVSGFGVNGMACDRTSNTMYVAMTDGGLTTSQIGIVDLTTGIITAIGTPNTTAPGLIDIAFDESGQMYGWGLVNDESYLIDKATGDVTVLGSLGYDANYGQGGNYNADDGLIYLTAYNSTSGGAELRVLDTSTGGTTFLSGLPASQMTAFGVPHTSSGPQPGVVPPGLISFNLYRDGVNIANVPYQGEGTDEFITYVDNNLDPATYLYDVSAVYDLTDYGFPGEEGESAWDGTDTVTVAWGFDLPFFEGWDNGSFDFQGWRFNDNSANWRINSQTGNPEPSAEFTWDPLLENDYTSTLTSNPIMADMLTEGGIYFDFDLALDDRNSTGMEKLEVEVYNGSTWNNVAEFVNDGSFDFTSTHIDITNYAMGKIFQVRFNAIGQNSFDIISWFVDNISIYRECMAPTDLSGIYTWNAAEDFGAEVCWEAPYIPGPISEWIHWDSGSNFSGVGLTDGGVFSVATRWDAGQLSAYDGTSITKVKYFLQDDGSTNTVVKIWSGANASTLLYEEDVTATSLVGDWSEVTLTTPIVLDVNEELWVGYTVTQTPGTFPAGTDEGPAIAGYGDMITTDGIVWDPLSGFGLDYNWNVECFVTGASSSLPAPTPIIDNTVYTSTNGTFVRGIMKDEPVTVSNTTSRAITGFNVYRKEFTLSDYELYTVVDYVEGQTSYCYFDAYPNVAIGATYDYQVTANYASDIDACESVPAMDVELLNDYVEVFITGIDNPESFLTNVYPNPAQDRVTVTSSLPMTQLTVTNYIGQIVYTNTMNNATSVELNTSSYQTGVYLVKIETNNGVVTKRVVITK